MSSERVETRVEVRENHIVRSTVKESFQSRFITKHSVAPAEYHNVYNKTTFPRSVFTSDKIVTFDYSRKDDNTVYDSPDRKPGCFGQIFRRSSAKRENIPSSNPDDKEGTTADDAKVGDSLSPERPIRKSKFSGSLLFLDNAVSKKIFKFGERGSGFKTKGPEQDFYELREAHLNSGTLFEDPEFPANSRSLSFDGRADRRIVWKRPREIHADPQLFIEGFSRFDVQQGELGDCWLLAAVANITLYKRLFFQIVPEDQGFDEDYAGIFHFRFWQYGRWVDVVIDDRLPTIHDELVYLHSSEKNEFWSALLEKAYAKIHGCYEALKGGSTCEAMEDFTGGVTEMYEMEAAPPNLFKIMQKAYERCSLMGCSIEPDPNVFEAQTPEGLIRGHAYSITKICFVDIATPNVSGKIPLIRMRNPWGNEVEWNGPWSDGAPEWRYITPENQQALGLNFDNDGEFWISYKDFQTHFSRLEICNLNPDSLTGEEFSNKKKWIMSVFEGRWVKGVTAGGCRNFLETFWHNPQYRVTLTQVDEEEQDNKCTLIIALMQKNRRKLGGGELLTMGFAIYHLPYPDRVPKPLDLNFFKYNASVARSPSFINLREVSCRFRLPPGSYCIVPSTYDPGEEAEFLLRVFTENESHSEYDGSYSDYLRQHPEEDNRIDNEGYGEDRDDDRPPSYPAPQPPYSSGGYNPTPSNVGSSYPYPDNPYPTSHYPAPPYPPNPYPQNPYPQNPYPQNPYGGYQPNPYPPQSPSYPHYPPSNSGDRSPRSSDPIINFFTKLFK